MNQTNPLYEENLKLINKIYPDKAVLNSEQVAVVTGYSPRYVTQKYTFSGKTIPVVALANQIK